MSFRGEWSIHFTDEGRRLFIEAINNNTDLSDWEKHVALNEPQRNYFSSNGGFLRSDHIDNIREALENIPETEYYAWFTSEGPIRSGEWTEGQLEIKAS